MLRTLALGLALIVAAPDVRATPPEFRGVIAHIDADAGRMHVVGDGGREYWFAASPTVAVTIHGYAAWFDDLRPGYRVHVTFDPATTEALRIDAEP